MTSPEADHGPQRRAARFRRGAALCLACVLLAARPAAAAAFFPASDDDVLEILPAGTAHGVAASAASRDEALARARALLDRGRRLGDPRDYGYAETLVAPWLARRPDDVDLRLVQARVRQFRHDFDGARRLLDTVIAREPAHDEAWLLRAGIAQVQGRTDAARRDCVHLLGRGDPLIAATCIAAVGGRGSQRDASIDLLQRGLARADASAPALRLWAQTTLGELLARRGDRDAAAAAFRAALEIDGEDVYARAAYADLLLDSGQAGEALALVGTRPQADALLLRAALAAAACGDPLAPQLHAAFAERVAEMRARGDFSHRRELARFTLELEHAPGAALQLALDNWAVQREPADAALVFAAAAAAGQPEAAAPVRDFLREHGLDAELLASGGAAR